SIITIATVLRRPGLWISDLPLSRQFGMTSLHLPLDQHALDLGDGFRRIEMLGAGFGAIHDGVTAIEPERVFEIVEPVTGGLVARIHDEAVCLEERCRAEEALRVPPIARTCRRTAGAEDALVEPVEFLPVVVALLPFLLRRGRNGLQPGLDRG